MVFDIATEMGFLMTLLDIGGGMSCRVDDYTGQVVFNGFPEVVNHSLAAMFPDPSVRVIAEPGRYFAEHIGSAATQVFSRRQRVIHGQAQNNEYWLSDGIYGGFNCIFYDHVNVAPGTPLWSPHLAEPTQDMMKLEPSTIWGPTCDGLDCVQKGAYLPHLRVGDWLVFHSFGAYTIAGATDFNGIQVSKPNISYIF
eukprot:scaffold506801_cov42-Prasinocladus_malaysianus.AAC.1